MGSREDIYGAWPYIFGTLVSSFLALLLAVPVAIGTAIFLTELAPKWMRTPISFMVELLAAVPSVVYGLWGVFVLVPALRPVQAWLSENWGEKPIIGPFVEGAPMGYSMMAGALILAIMVLPFITAVSREVLKAVPPSQREAAFGLGATHWEAIGGPILRYARSGILGAIILGLARAVGETMAITMVIGNGREASLSLLAPGNTLASALANQFAEASGKQLPSLMYVALCLFGVTIIVNAIARMLIWNMARGTQGAARE
jgi:phosphate transport system permease protein